MTLASDIAGLRRILDAHVQAVARFEQSLDRYEPEQVRAQRVTDYITQLREQTKTKARPWVASIFGDADSDGPAGGTFWSTWSEAHEAVRQAKDRAVSGTDWSRLVVERERLAGVVARFMSTDEARAWYETAASDGERLTLQHYQDLLARWPLDDTREFRSQLSRDYDARLETPAVRRARERVAEVAGQRIEAYRLFKALLAAVDLIDVFATFDPLARLERRIQATTQVDSWRARVDWEFKWLDRVAGVSMPAVAQAS